MKIKFIIGISVALVFVVVALLSFPKNKIEYATIDAAKTTGNVVQINGSWIKDKGQEYDSKENKFTFYMTDQNQKVVKVVFAGSRPNNFNTAPMIVVKGKFEGDVFASSEILTKCPSKYEGNADNLK